ncbi:thioesterase family protein [Streptomyces griseiscabiei]|uniref:Thioesterase family protein n=1 Tax=Streptomyces griseiscabiei TaxID=2993540 RepID=A0ABU4L1U4_9ACTN|nr:thioesterase family protein [Streptomyces griseiscabiei]MBZ3906033.1 thioesterase family protein [Streptomyces griseiscabiei]MDX2909666.1 thioesterase family protein [Streptomyces griseiscabiei]
MMSEPFYHRTGTGTFEPTRATESPWDQSLQHGGPPSALLLGEIERAVAGHGRITAAQIDFLGAIPREPGQVEVRTLRPGRRVRLDAATLTIRDRVVAEARCWTMATGTGADRQVEHRRSPLPALPDTTPGDHPFPGFPGAWHYPDAIEWRFVHGGGAQPGPAAVWTRVRVPVVGGEAVTPLQRLAVVADSANGISGELPLDRFLFVPTALQLNLHRHPAGEWILLDARTSLSGDGIGATVTDLYDLSGTLGTGTQPLLVQPR